MYDKSLPKWSRMSTECILSKLYMSLCRRIWGTPLWKSNFWIVFLQFCIISSAIIWTKWICIGLRVVFVQDIDECSDHNRCVNGGTCVNSHGSYYCRCIEGFGGRNCESDHDNCVSSNKFFAWLQFFLLVNHNLKAISVLPWSYELDDEYCFYRSLSEWRPLRRWGQWISLWLSCWIHWTTMCDERWQLCIITMWEWCILYRPNQRFRVLL